MTITKLRGAEYLLRSVADGVEDYFMGAGEAPGVWHGRWAEALGLTGVVAADHLRALVEGLHPHTGVDLLAGHRERTVKAIDLTLSAPKSASLLWAFGGDEVAAEVSIAVVEAATTAVDFMERHAAVARQQRHGVRRRVDTLGLAVAMFMHRTSRDGDPQIHVHSLIPSLVQRADGTFVAVDANPVHEWLKASGSIFQSELQRHLTERLGVAWGPERNGCRELIGFTPEQRRAFSKRTTAIETVLEAGAEAVTAKERMRADDRASLLTRNKKDRTLTPDRLRSRWDDEATAAGIASEGRLRRTVCHQATPAERPDPAEVFAELVDPEAGLCATRARFGHAHVVERVAALSAGGLTVTEIEDLATEFLRTQLVVRLVPSTAPGQRKPPEWSTVEHRQLEDRVLSDLAGLQNRSDRGLHPDHVSAVIGRAPVCLGADQQAAVGLLCGPGTGLRVVLAPAGHGKTALTATAAEAVAAAGRPVLALATTNKAVAELRAVGLDASTIARFRLDDAPLPAGSVVIVDEVSQVSTRDAHAVLAAVSATSGAVLWCLGDDDQGRPVQPGGLAAELRRLADHDQVAAAELTINRRQQDPAERDALARYRSGDITESQAIRDAQGWEHDHHTPPATRDALAAAAVADADHLGAEHVVVLAVSHADCEDLADRIRAIRSARGELGGPTLEGPGWGANARRYAAGDRILFHTSLAVDGHRFRLDRQSTKTGGLRQLRPDTRRAHQDLLAARDTTDARLQDTQEKLREDRTMEHRAGSAVHEHARWTRANQWRQPEIDRIDRQLADHWTNTVLAAVHQDDPLAYGLDQLRSARAVLSGRRGGRAEEDLSAVDDALARDRAARISAIASGAASPEHLTSRLGPVPSSAAARDMWCGLAYQLEARLDRGLRVPTLGDRGGISISDRLAGHRSNDPLNHPRTLIAASQPAVAQPGSDIAQGPDRWLTALDRAFAAHQTAECQCSREIDHDLGISL